MAVKHRVFCNVPKTPGGSPCGKEILSAPPMNVPKEGEEPGRHEREAIQGIVQHLMKHHPEYCQFAMNTWQQFLGFMVLGHTRSEDPMHGAFMAQMARQLAKMSTIPVTEDQLQTAMAEIGFTIDDPHREKTLIAMRGLIRLITRDIPAQPAR